MDIVIWTLFVIWCLSFCYFRFPFIPCFRILFIPFPMPSALFHGQSFDGQKNDPLVSLASFQKALAAKGSPSMGYKMILTGTRAGSRRIASLNRLRRFLPETLFPQGFFAPMVGRLSDSRKILSGAGFISADNIKSIQQAGALFRNQFADAGHGLIEFVDFAGI